MSQANKSRLTMKYNFKNAVLKLWKYMPFYKEPTEGLVQKVPYFWTSNDQNVVLKKFLNSSLIFSTQLVHKNGTDTRKNMKS